MSFPVEMLNLLGRMTFSEQVVNECSLLIAREGKTVGLRENVCKKRYQFSQRNLTNTHTASIQA